MSKEAEEAAGHEAWLIEFPDKRGFWDKLTDEDRAYWIGEGMRIVRAYQRAAWREPTAEDVSERKPKLTTIAYMRLENEWSQWSEPMISTWFKGSGDYDEVRVQDLPPLPEPKS
jgi:TRAP-type C4-dicarboxylate transport system substrate-binding protein